VTLNRCIKFRTGIEREGVSPANRGQAFRAARQPAPILHAGIIVRSAFCADVAFIEEHASTIPRAAGL